MARALAWHARGHRFDPDILHEAPQGIWHLSFVIQRSAEFFDIL